MSIEDRNGDDTEAQVGADFLADLTKIREEETLPDASFLDRIGEGDDEDAKAKEEASAREASAASFLDSKETEVEVEPRPSPKQEVSTEAEEETDSAEAEEDETEPEPFLTPDPDDGVRRRWYALHAHSGQEANVKRSLLAQAEQQGLSEQITQVLIPMEEVAEIKSGEKKISQRKFFPGYVLVRLPEHPEKRADLWHLIKETAGITGFIGSRTAPVPLEDSEIIAIAEEVRGERERPRPKVSFEVGERVKIIEGPFANFLGNIDEINADRGTLKVMVVIFERLTSVEVEFWQVEKS